MIKAGASEKRRKPMRRGRREWACCWNPVSGTAQPSSPSRLTNQRRL
jgi:hypothetical protein